MVVYDIAARELVLNADGFAQECERGDVGLLLARIERGAATASTPLRGVFARDDAWLSTGDLFRIDADGDYWRVDAVTDTISTALGVVFTGPIRDALGDLPAVDLAVAYGVPTGSGDREVAVAAVTLRAGGGELTARDLTETLASLEPQERPGIVHVVSEIPVTTWYRPATGPLRARGVPRTGWYLDRARDRYRPLTGAVRRALIADGTEPAARGSGT